MCSQITASATRWKKICSPSRSRLGQAIMIDGDPLLEKISAVEELVLRQILAPARG